MTERSFISVVIFYDHFRFGGLCINEFVRPDELRETTERGQHHLVTADLRVTEFFILPRGEKSRWAWMMNLHQLSLENEIAFLEPEVILGYISSICVSSSAVVYLQMVKSD